MSQYSPFSDSQFPYLSYSRFSSDNPIDIVTHNQDYAEVSQASAIVHEQRPGLTWLQKIWNALVKAFEQSNEPFFWQTRDRDGTVYWQCYDPIRNSTLYFASEDEARIWLDQSPPFQ